MGTIALNMIVLNAEERLRRLLPKVAPAMDQIVVGVDERTTDATREVLAEYNAIVVPFTFDDDFAAARNVALERTTTDWMLWLDDDDEVDGLDKLPELLAATEKDEGDAVHCPYFYNYDESIKQWTLINTRERLVWKPEQWKWVNRVHECLVRRDGSRYRAVRAPEFAVLHRSTRPVGERSDRNVRLLMKMLSDDIMAERPYEARTCSELGHELMNRGQHQEALFWLGQCVKRWPTSEESYAALVAMSECFRALGEYAQARHAAHQAMMLQSEWADAYLALMLCAAFEQKWEDCLRWAQAARTAKPRDALLSLNPMSYRFDPYLSTSLAYMHLGRIPEAEREIAEGLKIIPTNNILLGRKAICEGMHEAGLVQEAMRRVLEDMTRAEKRQFWRAAPRKVRTLELLRRELSEPPRGRFDVAFLCPVNDVWSPASSQSLGGSETAVIWMSKLVAEAGLRVVVFAHPGLDEGMHGKVWWADYDRIQEKTWEAEVAIAWRLPEAVDEEVPCKAYWLWCHDLHYHERITEEQAQRFELIMPVSEWHGRYLLRQYPFLANTALWPTRNGLPAAMLKRAVKPVAKRRNTAIWTSSPDRGLERAVQLWPKVRKHVPDAELHCCYAWGWDKVLQAPAASYRRLMTEIKGYVDALAARPSETGIYWHGALSKKDLYKMMAQTNVWAYPTDYLETFCLSALETAAHGCIPATSRLGALPETLGPLGSMTIPGWVRSPEYEDQWLSLVIGAMSAAEDSEVIEGIRKMGRAHAATLTWEAEAERWVAKIKEYRGSRVAA